MNFELLFSDQFGPKDGHSYDLPRFGEVYSLESAFTLAIHLAFKGAGKVSPNPLVGCVILDQQNRLVSTGFHSRYGGLHAEANALLSLPPSALKDATVIVTLEPCAHEGKTSSCAKALAKLPIKKVYYGLIDPNPLVAGQGLEILKAQNIQVEKWPDRWTSKLEATCEHFLVNFKEKRPFVSLKFAASLDGIMNFHSGESKWITSSDSRLQAHFLRGTHEAILVGSKTVEVDNPSLDIRHPLFSGKKNKVIVLTSQNPEKFKDKNIHQVHEPNNVHYLKPEANIHNLLTNLWNQGIKSILVEGGSYTISRFIEAGTWDRLYFFQAPVILGGQSGQVFSSGIKLDTMKDKLVLVEPLYLRIGNDQLISGKRK